MSETTYLITGGAGFIGSGLGGMLIDAQAGTVVNIDKLPYAGNPHSLASVPGDARDHFERADMLLFAGFPAS